MSQAVSDEQVDLLLGRTAVDRGLISPDQLREALVEQSRGVTRGRMRPRRLGAILASWKFMTDDQVLTLQNEATERIREHETWQEQDQFFGQILIDRSLIRQEQLDECMKEQAEAIHRGESPIPLLGELLVMKGYVAEEAVAEALMVQKRTILACASCGRRCTASREGNGRPAACPECGGKLDDLFDLERSATRLHAAEAARPDTVKLGKYEIQRVIGRGRMGAVYEALDTQLNRKVALKFMLSEIEGSNLGMTRMVERFGVEAEMAARLPKHPNIVSVYEAGTAEGKHFIAMELVQGLPMSLWKRDNKPSLRRQLRLLRDVAAAVDFAHENGVLHRDLKPQNIMVDADDQPLVTDFGLAQAVAESGSDDSAKRTGVAGTPRYMSPEQTRGDGSIDRRSDVFSLGVILYEILTGQPPFHGPTPQETRRLIREQPVPPLGGRIRGLPRTADPQSLERICMKALVKDPSKRTASAGDLARDLGRWLKSIEPKPAAMRKKRVSPLWIVGGVALFLAAAVPLLLQVTASASIDGRVQDAYRQSAAGRVDEALKTFENILIDEPDHGPALRGYWALRVERAQTLRRTALDRLDRALQALTQAQLRIVSDRSRSAVDDLRKADEAVKAALKQLRTLDSAEE